MADTSAGGHPKLSFAAAARAVATSTNKEKFERLAPIRSDESDPKSAPTARLLQLGVILMMEMVLMPVMFGFIN